MAIHPTPRLLALGTIAVVALGGAFLAQDAIQAQEETTQTQEAAIGSEIIVGTYEPQRVAEQYGINAKLMQQMAGLQQRMQTAQQQNNQQEMQQIQAEAQQVQQDVIGEFEQKIEDALPAVAEETGVDVVAVQVAYLAEGIETRDVTNELIAEMGGTAEEATEQDTQEEPEPLQQQ